MFRRFFTALHCGNAQRRAASTAQRRAASTASKLGDRVFNRVEGAVWCIGLVASGVMIGDIYEDGRRASLISQAVRIQQLNTVRLNNHDLIKSPRRLNKYRVQEDYNYVIAELPHLLGKIPEQYVPGAIDHLLGNVTRIVGRHDPRNGERWFRKRGLTTELAQAYQSLHRQPHLQTYFTVKLGLLMIDYPDLLLQLHRHPVLWKAVDHQVLILAARQGLATRALAANDPELATEQNPDRCKLAARYAEILPELQPGIKSLTV
jgi:hypothetical protein